MCVSGWIGCVRGAVWERLGEWVCACVYVHGLVMLNKWAGAKSHVCVHVDGYVCGEELRCVQLNVVKLLYKLQYYNVYIWLSVRKGLNIVVIGGVVMYLLELFISSVCYCSAVSVAMHSFSNIDDEDETGNLVFSES